MGILHLEDWKLVLKYLLIRSKTLNSITNNGSNVEEFKNIKFNLIVWFFFFLWEIHNEDYMGVGIFFYGE